MRTLSSTLQAAQQGRSIKPLPKIVLTSGGATYTYTQTRILDITHSEEVYSQKATVLLDNSDKSLNEIDLKGFRGVISWGVVTSEGEEYSACAPLYVLTQEFASIPGKLVCELQLYGILDLMAQDEASAGYAPESTNTDTVKTIINAIAGATLACFNHCTAYTVTWDSEDSLIDSYQPKDSFRVYTGDSRLAKIRWLLDLTNCVARFENDGNFHIFQPTTTGTTYNYEYSLASGHTFFSKAHRTRLTIPNYIVVKSQEDDDPQYTGSANDAVSYALLPKRSYKRLRLESNAQAASIASAILAKHQLGSDVGSASVPLNVGAELYDYLKVTDARAGDSRTGNIGYIKRHYAPGKWEMAFSFGNWFSLIKARKALNELKSLTDAGAYFSRLEVKDLVAENIDANNINMIWLDPDNTINLSLIGDDLDHLADGAVYARVKSLHLDAGQIILDASVYYNTGYDPSTKRRNFTATPTTPYDLGDMWTDGTVLKRCTTARAAGDYVAGDWTQVTVDAIADGTTYQRVLSTQITAGKIVLSSTGFIVSEDYVKAASERVVLSSAGLTMYGDGYVKFWSGGSTVVSLACPSTTNFRINAFSGVKITLHGYRSGYGTEIVNALGDTLIDDDLVVNDIDAVTTDVDDIGDASRFDNIRCYDIYAVVTHFQKYDDLAIIRGFKPMKDNPDKIDLDTVPDFLKRNKENYLVKVKMKAGQRKHKHLARLREMEQSLGRQVKERKKDKDKKPELRKHYDELQGQKIKVAESISQLDMMEQEYITKAEKHFDDVLSQDISNNRLLSLASGALSQVADKLDSIESRLGALEAR